jgi:hypothetical protein
MNFSKSNVAPSSKVCDIDGGETRTACENLIPKKRHTAGDGYRRKFRTVLESI